jgi:signal transduction histidine kinase
MQAQKLEVLGQLTSSVAHDFNNLTTLMAGYSTMLLAHLEQDDPLYEAAEGIKKISTWAATLTQQLLAFSRQRDTEFCTLDLNSALCNLDKILQRLLGQDIELVTRLAPDLGCIWTDPGQMEQSIINLVINARDAMPAGGKLTISTANIILPADKPALLWALKPGPYVKLTVSDTGCGMNAETRARLFEPFFTTKSAAQGTGLGLSMVHDFVRTNGGSIRVNSAPNVGTTFEIALPTTTQSIDGSYHIRQGTNVTFTEATNLFQ